MTTAEMKEVIEAFENGKTIEYLSKALNEEWTVTDKPCWDFYRNEYRVKPEPIYKPYDSVKEIGRDKWFVKSSTNIAFRIEAICCEYNTIKVDGLWYTLPEFVKVFTYEDGTPCGKLVEE